MVGPGAATGVVSGVGAWAGGGSGVGSGTDAGVGAGVGCAYGVAVCSGAGSGWTDGVAAGGENSSAPADPVSSSRLAHSGNSTCRTRMNQPKPTRRGKSSVRQPTELRSRIHPFRLMRAPAGV